MMLTIYIVSTGHYEFLEQSIQSVLNCDQDICLVVIETSDKQKNISKSNEVTTNFGLDLLQLTNYKLPEVANYVLEITKTDYLMRLDADDWISDDFLSVMLRQISKHNFDAYIPSYVETDRNGNYLREVSREQLLVSKVKDNPPHGACTVFNSDFLRKVGGYSKNYDRQDGYYMWLKILRNGTYTCIPEAKFYYRQHESNITGNQRELWNVRASMLIDECFSELKNKAYCVIPILELDSLFGKLTMQPFLGFPTLLEYELNKLQIACDIYVYGPELLGKIIPSHIHHIVRSKFSNDQWKDIQEEVIEEVGIGEGYICVKNIEYPFVNPKYIEAAISAIHLFEATSCITVEELKKDIYCSSENGLKIEDDGAVQDNDRRYKRSGGIVAKRIINGTIVEDNLTTSLPADSISAIRVTEMRDFMDLKRLFK